MRTKKLTKKDRENLRSRKWLVFERSIMECMNRISDLRAQSQTMEQKKRLKILENRIRVGFKNESCAMGWDAPFRAIKPSRARTRLSIEAF